MTDAFEPFWVWMLLPKDEPAGFVSQADIVQIYTRGGHVLLASPETGVPAIASISDLPSTLATLNTPGARRKAWNGGDWFARWCAASIEWGGTPDHHTRRLEWTDEADHTSFWVFASRSTAWPEIRRIGENLASQLADARGPWNPKPTWDRILAYRAEADFPAT